MAEVTSSFDGTLTVLVLNKWESRDLLNTLESAEANNGLHLSLRELLDALREG